MTSPSDRTLLRADCANCAGLCCVALAFTRSADFAIDKPAGDPCVNLLDDFRCDIHPTLRDRGFKGCTVFDCLGAGQRVTAAMGDWRGHDDRGAATFAVFPLVRQLHELVWYLTEALGMTRAAPLAPELTRALDGTQVLASAMLTERLPLDIREHRDAAVALLRRASELERAGMPHPPRTAKPGADLIGAAFAGADLSGADLRGAYLIAADLVGARLDRTDLIGADLRDARLHGADLATALYVTQPQVNAALGDATTRLPAALVRPAHWT